MNSKRNAFCMQMLVFVIGMGSAVFAQPIFENNTPTGFSPADSTRQSRFVTDADITVLVDLNEAANATYPVIGNFHKVEASVPFFSDGNSAGYLSQAVTIDDNGVLHRAWVQQRGLIDYDNVFSTPGYGVVYSKSFDGGRTFTDTVSVSGTMRFDQTTPNINMEGSFATVDIVVDSKGNPRVTYAMDWSADGLSDVGISRAPMDLTQAGQLLSAAQVIGNKVNYVPAVANQNRSFDGIFFNYSNDGGSSWLPANNTVVLNDTITVGTTAAFDDYPGRHTAFPRMAITSTDDIFIVYQRGLTGLGSTGPPEPDIMLAKMDSDSLKLGSAQPVNLGASANMGSLGGVRVDPEAVGGVTPDIAIGDDDILHITWYVPANNPISASIAGETIEHKTVPAEDWNNVGALGLDQGSAGVRVGSFNGTMATAGGALSNAGLDFFSTQGPLQTSSYLTAANTQEIHLFPTIVVDRERTPDRVYILWKHTDALELVPGNDENIRYNTYNYDGQVGSGAAWGSQTDAFPAGGPLLANSHYAVNGAGLFQNGALQEIETNWGYVDRVAAFVDDRIPGVRGDLHIAFSAGDTHGSETGGFPALRTGGGVRGVRGATAGTNGIYYSRFNGTEWELPQMVASAANGIGDGVLAKHRQVFEPDITMRSGDDNVYMTFVGGSPGSTSGEPFGRTGNGRRGTNAARECNGCQAPGHGFRAGHIIDVQPLPYFKVIGRVTTFDDKSRPVGANQYQLTYNPVNPQASSDNNLVSITVADNQNGAGIGGATPSASAAPGGFLTGQWRNISFGSLGVTSLNPGETGAVFKGAAGQIQAQNDVGVFQGQVDDDGSSGFAEWGDDTDKNNLLVKLNVLGSDSATNVWQISTSTASKLSSGPGTIGDAPDSSSQSIAINWGRKDATAQVSLTAPHGTFVRPITATRVTPTRAVQSAALNTAGHPAAKGGLLGRSAAMGSYFMMGPDIDIVAANAPPSVSVISPDASTIGTGAFANETFAIEYTLFDVDNSFDDTYAAGVAGDTLMAALYAYPDNGLSSVQDIKTFATLLVDQRDDNTSTARLATDPPGTSDFVEGSSSSNKQTYVWDNPGSASQTAFGWAPITKNLDGNYYIYIVGDDGVNPAVFAVSSGALRIRHIPIIRSVAPIAADTVDTGEYSNLAKVNPYKIKFFAIDYDDNAQLRLFLSTSSGLAAGAVTVTGTFPNLTLALAGATAIQLSDTLRTDEDSDFDFDVTAQGAARDSVIVQGNYFIYAVAADEDTFSLGVSANALAVRHSPAFEFTAPLSGVTLPLDPSQQDRYTIEWQRGRSDQDLDGNAIISLYYTGVDPITVDYSGTDSTQLLATTGVNPGGGVLLAGNIREDDEGADDQFVWDFRNPPSPLPKVFRPRRTTRSDRANPDNPHLTQVGSTVDTAWVYAVLHDSLGNTRVQGGGAVLLRGGQQSTFQPVPRVTMKTPSAGGQTIVNGDIVRLEWDAFMIDDGTGTDDAYLRLYAAPKGKYGTITALESNASGAGGAQDVFIINSTTGKLAAKSTGNTAQAYAPNLRVLRESGPNFILWDTKTTSFKITGTPTEFDIFIAGSMDRRFGDNVTVGVVRTTAGTQVDSVASGIGSSAQKVVLSKSPGALRVEGADPIYSIELGPGTMTATTGDTLEMDILVNSQASSIDLMAMHLNVPRNYFEVIDMDAGTTGLQPFADSTGAFQTPSTIAQNDTTQGTDQFIMLNFIEAIVSGEVVGTAAGDSSQVAASIKLLVKQYSGGAPLDTSLVWSAESGRKTAFRKGKVELAAPAREGFVTLTPGARLIVTTPLEGRSNYSDTLDVHLRRIGSTKDVTDQVFIGANDVVLDTLSSSNDLDLSGVVGTFVATETVTGATSSATGTVTAVNGTVVSLSPVIGTFSVAESVTGGTSSATATVSTVSIGSVVLGDSVQVISDAFGTITLIEITAGVYELTMKADGYVSGRTDTLDLFSGMTLVPDPTFGSDVLGNLSPATPLGFLRGGDATGDNQVDIADANLIFSLWNKTLADASFVRGADINADGVINAIDLGFVTANFGNDGYGAAPVFKRSTEAGDNSVAVVEVMGVEEVDAWWPGRVFEVTTRVTGMSDVMAYDLGISYDPDRVKPLSSGQAVTEGDVFAENARGTLFFERSQPGLIEIAAGRVGRDMTASGDADLVTVRFLALADDPGLIEVVSGQLVNSAYQGLDMRVKKAQALPQIAALYQNFPNPFNPSTEIRFDIPTARNVKLRVYNQLGQTVRTLVQSRMKAGTYRIKWDGRTEAGHGVSSGVYFYSLEAGEYSQIHKMTLVK